MTDLGAARDLLAKVILLLGRFPQGFLEGSSDLAAANQELLVRYDDAAVPDNGQLLAHADALQVALNEVERAWAKVMSAIDSDAKYEAESKFITKVDALRRVTAAAIGAIARTVDLQRPPRSKTR